MKLAVHNRLVLLLLLMSPAAFRAISGSNFSFRFLLSAYESPGTPPRTPPPLLSPFILATSDVEEENMSELSPNTKTGRGLGTDTYDTAPAQSKSFPNTLTIINPIRKVHRMVYVHSSLDSASSSLFSVDSQAVHECRNLVVLPSSNNRISSNVSSPGTDPSGAPVEKKSPKTVQSPPPVYHGKRYLDSVLPDMCCAFYNNAFRVAAGSARFAFHSSVYSAGMMPEIAEIGFEENVDWEAVKRTISEEEKKPKKFPKIRVCVSDETGRRVKTSFDSSGCEASSSDAGSISPSSLWSSLDCELSEGLTLGNDGWTVVPQTQNSCCKKCGHHQQTSEAS